MLSQMYNILQETKLKNLRTNRICKSLQKILLV